MRRFAEAAGDKMRLEVILYDGAETFSLGPDLLAAPLSTLWGAVIRLKRTYRQSFSCEAGGRGFESHRSRNLRA